jgi:hypothetical protein
MGLGGPGSGGLAHPSGVVKKRKAESKVKAEGEVKPKAKKPKASKPRDFDGDDDERRRTKTNQPDLPPGTRLEVEFDDDEVGKCWFDGIVDHQTETGTVIHFDDGDIQDLDLKVIPYGIIKEVKRSEILY